MNLAPASARPPSTSRSKSKNSANKSKTSNNRAVLTFGQSNPHLCFIRYDKINSFRKLNARKPIHCLGSVGVGKDHVTPALTSKFHGIAVLGFAYDAPASAGRETWCGLLLH